MGREIAASSPTAAPLSSRDVIEALNIYTLNICIISCRRRGRRAIAYRRRGRIRKLESCRFWRPSPWKR